MASELRLPALALPGLSPDSLGNYLASLGLLRVLSRKWPSTRIAWRDEVLQVIGGPTSLDELLDELVRIAASQSDSDRPRGRAAKPTRSSRFEEPSARPPAKRGFYSDFLGGKKKPGKKGPGGGKKKGR